MNSSEAKLRASAAVPGLLLALFQCWYVYLPDGEAVRFVQCKFTAHLDCYKSLSLWGSEMTPFGIPVFVALAGLYLLTCLLLAGSALSETSQKQSWRAWAALLAFPCAGLSIYVLLNDITNAESTSLSTLLILVIGLGLSVLTVVRRVDTKALRDGVKGVACFAAIALVAGFFIHGAGRASLAAANLEIEREGEPATLRWSTFATQVPRLSAAHLGKLTARRDLLLFLDPEQEASRDVMRALAAVDLGDDVCVFLYDPRGWFLAKPLPEFLRAPDLTIEEALPTEVAQAQLKAAGVAEFPTAIWHNGRKTGDLDVAAIIASLKRG